MEKFIRAAGIPVRVVTQGDQHPHDRAVVLLHGYLETLEVWDDLAKALGRHIYTVMPDLPGHGLSGTHPEINTMEFIADVVADVQQQLGIAKVLLVGHSMGGYAALALARKYPQQTAGLCLFHSTPNADSDEKRINRDREIDLFLAEKRDLLFKTTLPNMFAPQNLQRMQNRIEELQGALQMVDNSGIIACIRGMAAREDMNDFLVSFKQPLLFIFGKNDVYISWETAQALMQKFPQAQTAVLENSGHCGFYEEPAASAEALIAWVTNTEVKK